MNETLGSWTLFSSKLDSLVIKTLETHFFTLSECAFNVLITGKSYFDEKNFICKELTSNKICILIALSDLDPNLPLTNNTTCLNFVTIPRW